MATTTAASQKIFAVDRQALTSLISALGNQGYRVIGPRVREGAIIFDFIDTLEDMPSGYVDSQLPGQYRLSRNHSAALFAYASGCGSLKRFLHEPEVKLFQIERQDGNLSLSGSTATESSPRYAIFGARACDLAAVAILDRALLGDKYADPFYRARRENIFVVAVHCTRPSANCFCTSMGTGPAAKSGFDIAITEVLDGDEAFYVLDAASKPGTELLAELKFPLASARQLHQAESARNAAVSAIQRRVELSGLPEALYEAFDHQRWEDVAHRCLSCGNCTQVCPTCFCTTVEDVSDVSGEHAERLRKWDSCFVQSFSYIHGGSVRMSLKSRYRQWLTHKFATWVDQFGAFGCVGCGRCITWCPAGIDITEELAAICAGGAVNTVKGD